MLNSEERSGKYIHSFDVIFFVRSRNSSTWQAQVLRRGALEFSVLRFCHFVGRFFVFWTKKNFGFLVLFSGAVSRISVFQHLVFRFSGKNGAGWFLCGSLCSDMLRYFVCFYFTVNPGQIAMWDSGFLMEVYSSYRRAFCQRKIFPNVLSIAIQSRILVNSCPRPDILVYTRETKTRTVPFIRACLIW